MQKCLPLILRGLILSTLLLLGSLPGHAETLKLATLHWPPYIDKDKINQGFISEVVKAAFTAVGYDIDIHFVPWSRGLKSTQAGRFDGIFPAYFSNERQQLFSLSESIGEGELGFFKRQDSDISYRSLIDLKPYRIGVVRGYVNTEEFDQADYLNKDLSNSDAQNLRKLLKQRIELAVADKATALYLMDTEIPKAKGKLEFLPPPLQVKKLYVMFSKANSDYQKRTADFNHGLTLIRQSGEYQKILGKYGK